jgi:hypothetical protein
MDNFVGDPDILGGEVLAGLVGHGNGTLYAPTKAEGFGEFDGDVALSEGVIVGANFLNQVTLVLRFQSNVDFCLVAKAFAMVVFGVVERSLKCFGIHGFLATVLAAGARGAYLLL